MRAAMMPSRRILQGAMALGLCICAAKADAAASNAKEIVVAPDAPKAVGPYSQAVKANGMVFVAGQLPLDPKTSALVPGGIEPQTERVMENIKAILTASGLTFRDVVMSNCYLTNMDDFAKSNAVYAKSFPQAPPARATVGVTRLAKDAQVEVAVIAVHSSP